MKKILLTIIGLAMASPAWSAQTAVTEISGTQASIGALKTQVNTKLGAVESNRQDHEARVAAMETGKETKAVVQATAPADTTVDWYDTDQESGVLILKHHNGTTWVRASSYGVQYASSCASIAAGMCVDTDDGKLYYHNGTAVVEVGTGVGGTTYTAGTGIDITSGVISSTVTGTLPSATEGQGVQKGATAWEAVDLAPLAFTDNVSRNSTTGVVSVPVTATATSGSAVPLTSGGAYTALGGKQDTLVSGTNIKTINSTSILGSGNIDIAGGTGGYVTLSAIPYSDVACTTGQYGYYGSTAYLCTGGFWTSKWTLTSHSNPTPTTYNLTITPSGFTGADKFTYNSTDYTTEQTITGLSTDASFTVTPDTGRAITCAGTGITDNTGGSYMANTDTANVVATCTSTSTGVSIFDNFNRANGSVGSNYTTVTGASAVQVLSNRAADTSGGWASSIRTAETFSANQKACATVASLSASTNGKVQVGVRMSTGAIGAGYIFGEYFNGTTHVANLTKSGTAIGSYSGTPIGAGDVICVQAVDSGANVVITPSINGTPLSTYTDTVSPIASGFPGKLIRYTSSALDDFSAEDL